jgi:hypothetical protein
MAHAMHVDARRPKRWRRVRRHAPPRRWCQGAPLSVPALPSWDSLKGVGVTVVRVGPTKGWKGVGVMNGNCLSARAGGKGGTRTWGGVGNCRGPAVGSDTAAHNEEGVGPARVVPRN